MDATAELSKILQNRQNRKEKAHKIAELWTAYSSEIFAGLSVLTGGLSGWFGHVLWAGIPLVIAALAFAISAGVLAHKRERTSEVLAAGIERYRSELEREKETLQKILRGVGRNLLDELGIWSDGTCRLSLYGHVGEVFYLILRISSNPELQKAGRPTYPDNQGSLALLWKKAQLDQSSQNKESAKKKAIKHGIPKEVVDNLTMYPRRMVGIRIENDSRESVGIALLESESPQELDNALDEMGSSTTFETVVAIVSAAEHIFEPMGMHVRKQGCLPSESG